MAWQFLLTLACEFPTTAQAAAWAAARRRTAWQSCFPCASSAQFGPTLNLPEQCDAPAQGRSAIRRGAGYGSIIAPIRRAKFDKVGKLIPVYQLQLVYNHLMIEELKSERITTMMTPYGGQSRR
jgi:hypothetical protein